MLNFQPELTYERALQTNQRAVERHVNDEHYVRGFTPGDFVLGGPAVPTHALVTAAAPRWPAIIMLDGGSSFAVASWRKPSEWRTGQIRSRYWYTSDVGSTNNFAIQTMLNAIRDAEVLTGTLLVDSTSAVAGPVVANTVIRSAYVYTTVALGSDDEVFSLRLGRIGADASDTNANEFHLLYVEIEHIPALQVSQ